VTRLPPVWRPVVNLAVLAWAACGSTAPTAPRLAASAPPLPPPPPVDPAVRGASYLAEVAASIQPAWGQFLEDCRLRLPADHPLNRRDLTAIAELAIERDGRMVQRIVTSSGNGDFDTAVFDVLGDASPLPTPPLELASDDDRVYLHWLFARDARQAGPRTARVVDVELPLLGVVDRLLAQQQLARAARRVAAARADEPQLVAAERVMIAALDEGLASSSSAARREAVEAIGRARVQGLARQVHTLAAPIADLDLRLIAIAASAALGDRRVAPALALDLDRELSNLPRVALARIEALVTLGEGARAVAAVRGELARGPTPLGLSALALVPDPELAPRLPGWMANKDPQIRAGVCATLPSAAPAAASAVIARGLRDAAAIVRASCVDALVRSRVDATGLRRLRELARDRDHAVRARAIAALGSIEPGHRLRAVTDPAPEVRAASVVGAVESDLRVLAADREPDVRAAALAALGDRARELAREATVDLSAVVRRAAIVVASDAELERLAGDPSPDVATAALVTLAGRRGRAEMTRPLLELLAASPRHGPERVRAALAWLLAR
jgi:hypothetical protein